MALVTKSVVAAGGADYTVVQTAVNAVDVTSDQWDIEIDDDSLYQEIIDVTGFTGTADATNYMRLTGGASNRHSGVDGTGHPRIEAQASANDHVIEIDEDYTVIEWLDLIQDTGGDSNEGVRILSTATEVLISHCLIHSFNNTNVQDGIYTDNGGTSGTPQVVYVDNCAIYNFERAGIHPQNYSGEAHQTYYIDHCSIAWNGKFSATVEVEAAAIYVASDGGGNSVHVINVSNTAMGKTETNGDERDVGDGTTAARTAPDGTVTWNGSHNLTAYANITPLGDIDGTDNTTNWQFADDGVAAVTKTADNWWVIKYGTYSMSLADLRLLNGTDAGNIALTNGKNNQGSEPDSRQDFSVDGTGTARLTTGVDIGFHQASSGAPTIVTTPTYSNHSGGTAQSLTYPTMVNDNLVLMLAAFDSGTPSITSTYDGTPVWGHLIDDQSPASYDWPVANIWHRVIDSTEDATHDLTLSASEAGTSMAIRLDDAESDSADWVSATDSGRDITADQPAATGLDSDRYYLIIMALFTDSDDAVTGFPTANENYETSPPGTGYAKVSVCTATVGGVTSYTPPATWTNGVEEWVTVTLAIPQATSGTATPVTIAPNVAVAATGEGLSLLQEDWAFGFDGETIENGSSGAWLDHGAVDFDHGWGTSGSANSRASSLTGHLSVAEEFGIYQTSTGSTDHRVQVLIDISSLQDGGEIVGVVGRMPSGTSVANDIDGYAVVWAEAEANELRIARVTNGVLTYLGSGYNAGALSATDLIGMEVEGTGATVTIRSYFNGTERESVGDTDAGRHTTGTYAGVYNDTGGTNWAFEIGDWEAEGGIDAADGTATPVTIAPNVAVAVSGTGDGLAALVEGL